MSGPLIVVSSLSGNTRIVAHALSDEIPGAHYVDLSKDMVPQEEISHHEIVALCFWCDKGKAPENIISFAKTLSGKRIACFATLGGDPSSEAAQGWMRKTATDLVASGKNNQLVGTFMCRGKISDEVFDRMTKMLGGVVSPERLENKRQSETHPDRKDLTEAVKAYRSFFD